MLVGRLPDQIYWSVWSPLDGLHPGAPHESVGEPWGWLGSRPPEVLF